MKEQSGKMEINASFFFFFFFFFLFFVVFFFVFCVFFFVFVDPIFRFDIFGHPKQS